MARLLVAAYLLCAACTSTRAPGLDETNNGASDVERPVSSVLVDGDLVAWTHGPEACVVDDPVPCPQPGPTAVVADLPSGEVLMAWDSGLGAQAIAGNAGEFYTVAAEATGGTYLWRLQPEGGQRDIIAGPFYKAFGPLADTSYVYLFAIGDDERTRVLRISREEPANVVTLASDVGRPTSATLRGGFVWWISWDQYPVSLYRLPIAGGAPDRVFEGALGAIASDVDGVFVTSTEYNILRISFDKQVTPVVESIEQVPSYMIADRGDLFWMNEGDGRVFRATQAGGMATPVAIDPVRFGVADTSLVVDIRPLGFDTIPR